MIKTLLIRRGEKLSIRAMAFPAGAGKRDKCPTLAFFEEESKAHSGELEQLKALLDYTTKYGPPQNDTKFKHLTGTDGLYEFKTGGGLRLFCFFDGGQLIVCTHGLVKKRQKADPEEIKRAKNLKTDYETAHKRGTLIHVQPSSQA